jgi:cysteine synthase A
MPVFESVVDTVGRTPLVKLPRISEEVGATLLGKLESRNPCASVKDRLGVALIRDAEQRGTLKPGATIVEATSGNTGIALAFASAALGYRLIITMPETMSKERVALLRMFGAEVVLTPGALMRAAVDRARDIAAQTPGAVQLRQFENPANPAMHEATTAREIWDDTGGRFDALVAGVGTGGTITGIGRFLRARRAAVKIVAVEPADSAVLSGCAPAPHYIQGIGAGFVPEVLDRSVIDEVVAVSERAALDNARRLAREEGILSGISAGAALYAAIRVGRRTDMQGKTIVVILPDTGERYMSTALAEDPGPSTRPTPRVGPRSG